MIYYRLRASSVLVCKGGVCKLSGFGFMKDIVERNTYEAVSSKIPYTILMLPKGRVYRQRLVRLVSLAITVDIQSLA